MFSESMVDGNLGLGFWGLGFKFRALSNRNVDSNRGYTTDLCSDMFIRWSDRMLDLGIIAWLRGLGTGL